MTQQKRKNIKVTLAAIILGAPLAAYSGDVVRLRTGQINSQAAQKFLYSDNLNSGSKINSRVLDLNSQNSASEYIVQFKNLIQKSDRDLLLSKGLQILGYLPDDALVVRGQWNQVRALEKESRINGILPYLSSFKLSPDLAPRSALTAQKMEAVVIKVFKSADLEPVTNRLALLSDRVSVRSVAGKLISVVAPQGLLPSIAEISGVEHIQPNPQMEIMYFDPHSDRYIELQDTPIEVKGDCSDLSGAESGVPTIHMDEAWKAGFEGEGQIATVADTGVDSGDVTTIHKDFTGAINKGLPLGLFGKSWGDPMGHGTHVAGSVLGRGTACNGKLRGSAPRAQLVAEGLWSDMMNNLGIPSPITTLFQKAYEEGARVHTNSWGSPQNLGVYDGFASQADEFMSSHPDMLILFAAGNSGIDKDRDGRIDPGSVSTPGTAKNVLTVGASKNLTVFGGIQKTLKELRGGSENWGVEPLASSKLSDNTTGLAMFSSRGPTQDGRLKPEIVAPGTNIISVRSQNPKASPMWGVYNQDYVYAGGTSMATPITAGAAVVVREILTKKWNLANPSGAVVKGVLIHTAEDLFPGQFGNIGAAKGQEILTSRPNNDEGYGRVHMGNVVRLDGNATHLVDNQNGLTQGQTAEFTINIQEGQSLLANMVYTDLAASPNAASTLVNDLDLVLVKPDGSQVGPNDHVNNNEMIELKGLSAGSYKLIVKASKIPSGKQQAFALIYSVK